MSDGCKQHRVMTTREWLSVHGAHGTPTKLRNEHQPPAGTYTIYTLQCSCGAKHVVTFLAKEQKS